MAVPLDEYPVHQVPLSMRYVATSDRHTYDRCIYQVFDRGNTVLITGLGVYPNQGVIDAYAAVRRGSRQVAVQASDAMGEDRMAQEVGPFRVEVLEPLRRIRILCDGDDHGVGYDLTWQSVSPTIDEPQHVVRLGDRVIIDGCRFAQTGSWNGTIRVGGDEIAVADWVGTRDRSWGIRPSGAADPPARHAEEQTGRGFWWVWSPLRFEDFTIMLIAQEGADGHRTLTEAVRVWPESSGRGPEQLGWPEFDIRYRSGTRLPEHATVHVRERISGGASGGAGRGAGGRRPLTIEVEPLLGMPLSVGCGYGDPDWSHGQWKGRKWVEGRVYDLSEPSVAARIPFGVIDHVARATLEGAEGWGIFEHASIGRHDPSGFADLSSVAG